MAAPPCLPRAVRILELNEGGAPVYTGLCVVEVHSRLVFSLRAHPHIRGGVVVWTNCPLSPADAFARNVYHAVLCTDAHTDACEGDWQAFIDVHTPGAFEMFLEFHRGGTGTTSTAAAGAVMTSTAHGHGQRARRRSSLTGAVPVAPPHPTRRGPTIRFVVQPELSLRLLRPLESTASDATPRDDSDARTASSGTPSATVSLGAMTSPSSASIPTSTLLPALEGMLAADAACVCESVRLPFPLEGITLQTQLTRCLGPIDAWLRMPANSDVFTGTLCEPLGLKFNFLHFTPVQALGGSDSAYSIADQLVTEPRMFAGNAYVQSVVANVYEARRSGGQAAPVDSATSRAVSEAVWAHPRVEAAKMAVLARMLEVLETRHGVLSMVDVVMNHTSTDSAWLASHPEAGYSLANSPHLRAAFELDEAILRVSHAVRTGRVANVSAQMRDEGAVNAVADVLAYHPTLGLPATRLWEFYCIDVQGALAAAVTQLGGVYIDEDGADMLTDADNVAGGDTVRISAPAPLHTGGVDGADISDERALEIIACRHPVVRDVLQSYRSRGYAEGTGQGCVHVSDADIDRIAGMLLQQRPAPSVSDTVDALKARSRAFVNSATRGRDAPDAPAHVHVATHHLSATPMATPVASPPADGPVPPAEQAFAYGRPPRAPVNASVGASPPPASMVTAPPSLTRNGRWVLPPFAAPMGGASTPHSRATTTRSGAAVSSPRARSVSRRVAAWSGGGAGGGSSSGSVGAAVSSIRAEDATELHGGVINDGTGGRFAVHVDMDRVIAALNLLPGVRVDSSDWTWPGVSSATMDSPASLRDDMRTSVTSGGDAYASAGVHGASPGMLSLLPSLHLIQRVLDAINLRLYKRYDEDLQSALNAIRGTAKYQWLHVWGGTAALTEDRPLVYSYFARIPVARHLRGASAHRVHVLACNGFIWNGDPEIDFTLPVDAARAFADIVRAGTAEEEYVKRSRDWSSKRQAAAAEYLLGADIITPPEEDDTAHPISAPNMPFPGAELLCMHPETITALCDAADCGDARAADAVMRAAAIKQLFASTVQQHSTPIPVVAGAVGLPGATGASPSSSPTSGSGTASYHASGGTRAAADASESSVEGDSVLQLDPNVMALPVCTASTPYIRRDIVIWGDCVKLRYGLTPADSPWLWNHMSVYVQRMATLFAGLRVDNAHGTPLHVAAYMIDIARNIRPDVYVNAELFTGSLDRDVEYVSRLGINSLVREAMQASSSGDLVCNVYSYGGVPIASLRPAVRGATAAARVHESLTHTQAAPLVSRFFSASQRNLAAAFEPELFISDAVQTSRKEGKPRDVLERMSAAIGGLPRAVTVYHSINGFPVASLLAAATAAHEDVSNSLSEAMESASSSAHRALLHVNEASVSAVLPASLPALFFDCTHDNPTPAEKRHAVDAVSTGVCVAAAVCATGTNRGFDIFVPANISVVTDTRLYADPLADETAPEHGPPGVPAYSHVDSVAFTAPPPSLAPLICIKDAEGVTHPRYGVDLTRGMRLLRRRLNALKQELAARGHTEIFASVSPAPAGSDIISIVRGHPWLPTSYVYITRSAFSKYAGDARGDQGPLPDVRIEGHVVTCVCAASMHVPSQGVRTQPPQGHRLRYPSLDDMLAAERGHTPALSSFGDALGVGCVTWKEDAAATPADRRSSTGPLQFDAHPRYINGLRCSLEYMDDTMLASDQSETGSIACCGLAHFDESNSGGHAVTLVKLDAGRFQPGSVLVLKVHSPRNVAIRGGVSAAPASPPAPPSPDTVPTIGMPLSSTSPALHSARTSAHSHAALPLLVLDASGAAMTTPVRARVASASAAEVSMGGTAHANHVRAVMAAVAFALHGPPPPRKPFTSSASANGLGSSASITSLLNDASAAGAETPASGRRLSVASGGTPLLSSFSAPRPHSSAAARKLSTFFGPSLRELEEVLLDAPTVTLTTLNVLLYRCHSEEMDDSLGQRGVYDVPGHGPLAWAGLAGVSAPLRHCRKWNDMSHAVLENLRRGPWLMDYTSSRLAVAPALAGVQSWMERHFAIVKAMPAGLRPQGFDRVVTAVYNVAIAAALTRMSGPLFPSQYSHSQHYLVSVPDAITAARAAAENAFFVNGNGGMADWPEQGLPAGQVELFERHSDPSAPLPFVAALALTSVQLYGVCRSAPLLALPLLETAPGAEGGATTALQPALASLCAGVEHFATGYMRIWGRDTFISLRGLLLVTGRFAEARETILSFATVLRHGLLPNLMDGGRTPRYNCRDAAFWFLQAVQDYVTMSEEGTEILAARVHRRFPSDDPSDYDPATGAFAPRPGTAAEGAPRVCTLSDILHEILSLHASGIHFREWNAGRGIDAHMVDAGFNIDIHVDASSGFVHGGNAHNCGTWMDKMGESVTHGTDGLPATPRDGADIEITALLYSSLRWLARMHALGVHTHNAVRHATAGVWTYDTWAARIAASFEKCFYVPSTTGEDTSYALDARYVHAGIRGVYKDTCGSAAGWSDYQLRPNQVIAMSVAPSLFNPGHASDALGKIEQQLLGEHQMGMKTLDPADWAYRGVYENSSDAERSTAKGWNYHQGPEWLWPYGYYLRARMLFPPRTASGIDTVHADVAPRVPPIAEYAACVPPASLRWRSYVALRRWVFARLHRHRAHLEHAPEAGLPELTNANGAFCKDSCTSQAWSGATILDALHDLHTLADAYESVGAVDCGEEDAVL